jgi:ArsR family transcriptional regulator
VAKELPVVRQRGVCCALPVEVDGAWAERTSELLKALADPTRLGMVLALRGAAAPVCICDFTEAYGLTQPTISHHMARLNAAGLVESEKRGLWVYYRLREELPASVLSLLDAVTAA